MDARAPFQYFFTVMPLTSAKVAALFTASPFHADLINVGLYLEYAFLKLIRELEAGE